MNEMHILWWIVFNVGREESHVVSFSSEFIGQRFIVNEVTWTARNLMLEEHFLATFWYLATELRNRIFAD